MAADFEVDVTLETVKGVLAAVPKLDNLQMSRNQTVHYRTQIPNDPNATVRIDFVPDPANPSGFVSPFDDARGNEKNSVTNSDPPLTLQRSGKFSCRCFVTRGNGDVIGWAPNNPDSGGNHVVR